MMVDARLISMVEEFHDLAKRYPHLTPPVVAAMQQTRAIEDLTQALYAIDNRRADAEPKITSDLVDRAPPLTSIGAPQYTGGDNTLRAKRK
jgi:hypothetical protein